MQQELALVNKISAEEFFQTLMIREPISIHNEFMFDKHSTDQLLSMLDMIRTVRSGDKSEMMDMYHDTVKTLEKEGYRVDQGSGNRFTALKEKAPLQTLDDFLDGTEQAFETICDSLTDLTNSSSTTASLQTRALLDTDLSYMLAPRLLDEVTKEGPSPAYDNKLGVVAGDGDKADQAKNLDYSIDSLAQWRLAERPILQQVVVQLTELYIRVSPMCLDPIVFRPFPF
jgi:hypothetical protein